ncbi:MAG: DUF5993 family protein, partial [Achromobacter mucicolens]
MVMMLPFVTGTLAVWFGLVGRRRPSVKFWLLTLVIFSAWCNYHKNTPLALYQLSAGKDLLTQPR